MSRRWNSSLHPRDGRGRFRPKATAGTFYAGKGGRFYGVKVGKEYSLGPAGDVKGIVGYAPPRRKNANSGSVSSKARNKIKAKVGTLDTAGTPEARAATATKAMRQFSAAKLANIEQFATDLAVRQAARRLRTRQFVKRAQKGSKPPPTAARKPPAAAKARNTSGKRAAKSATPRRGTSGKRARR